jgi:hypothetical protein
MEDMNTSAASAGSNATSADQPRRFRKEKIGVVVSNKMNKSITISVEKKVQDRMMRKTHAMLAIVFALLKHAP